jgi:hypothetical protein
VLIINEATDSAARFKLATKHKGMAMRDDEEGEWRVVIDLEWPKSQIPGIPDGNKKGWLLARGLMCRVKAQRETRAPTAVRTAAKLRRACSELGKEREGRSKTRAQTRHNTTKEQKKRIITARIPHVNCA